MGPRRHLTLHARAAAVAVAATALAWAPASPADAHPFGPPAIAEIAIDRTELTITWVAEPDDYAALGATVGELPATFLDAVADPVPDDQVAALDAATIARVERSPAVQQYVRDHLAVRQAAGDCPASSVDTDGLFSRGVRARFRCLSPIDLVEIDIHLLTDVHPAYRTVAVATDDAVPARTMYTVEQPTVTWRFGTTRATATSTPTLVLVAVLAAAVAAVCGSVVRRVTATRRTTAQTARSSRSGDSA